MISGSVVHITCTCGTTTKRWERVPRNSGIIHSVDTCVDITLFTPACIHRHRYPCAYLMPSSKCAVSVPFGDVFFGNCCVIFGVARQFGRSGSRAIRNQSRLCGMSRHLPCGARPVSWRPSPISNLISDPWACVLKAHISSTDISVYGAPATGAWIRST